MQIAQRQQVPTAPDIRARIAMKGFCFNALAAVHMIDRIFELVKPGCIRFNHVERLDGARRPRDLVVSGKAVCQRNCWAAICLVLVCAYIVGIWQYCVTRVTGFLVIDERRSLFYTTHV